MSKYTLNLRFNEVVVLSTASEDPPLMPRVSDIIELDNVMYRVLEVHIKYARLNLQSRSLARINVLLEQRY